MNYYYGKIIIGLLLLASLSFMVFEAVQTWQSPNFATVQPAKKVVSIPEPQQRQQKTSFYPSVPTTLPNLNEGYLFNQKRNLEDPSKKNGKQSAEKKEKIEFDQLRYNGSLIIGNVAKALISYPEPKKVPTKKGKLPRRRTTKNNKRSLGMETVRKTLEAGDILGSYRVKDIQPEKIVFQRGDKQIEKMLYDPEKKRIIAPKRKPQLRKTAKPTKAVKTRRRVTTRSKKSRENKTVLSRPRVIRRRTN
jgi:hypothetical protein